MREYFIEKERTKHTLRGSYVMNINVKQIDITNSLGSYGRTILSTPKPSLRRVVSAQMLHIVRALTLMILK